MDIIDIILIIIISAGCFMAGMGFAYRQIRKKAKSAMDMIMSQDIAAEEIRDDVEGKKDEAEKQV
jgi:hypothetical protein